jgi:hypothetical protein
MLKKLMGMLLITSLIAALISFSVSASTQIPAFTGFTTTETSIDAGDSVTFTISTLALVNHVFAEIDGERVNTVQQTRPAPTAGTKNWLLTFTPEETQDVTVYANTSNAVRGAAAITIPITVSGTLPGVVTINRVTRNATEYFIGDTVIFTIVTSVAAEHVFTQVDGNWARAVLTQTNEATGEKTWRLTVTPQVTQILNIYANTEYVRGSVSSRQTVEMKRIPLLTEVLQPFEQTNFDYVSSVAMGGRTYGNAIRVNLFGSRSVPSNAGWGLYNLGGTYNAVTGIFGSVDGTGSYDATISFIGDGRVIETFTLRAGNLPREMTVNVRGVMQLRIEINANITHGLLTTTAYVFAEATIR